MLTIFTTGFRMLYLSLRDKVNVAELILVRCQLSIFVGWVTAATILNIAIVLKSVIGLEGESLENFLSWTILAAAFVIYAGLVFHEKNPLYGLIYAWVLYFQTWNDNVNYLLYGYLVILLGLTGLFVGQKVQGNCDRGLFY
jgi:chromate transport protein ChrA